ncbi:MAG: tetrahydromethanopterin S-methyltransferase subunit A, partial [Methanobacteriales archaeon]|nr:tetrahydromethanopterin S-methyltransferase subunit A [Methanobacteriales archaeon]
RPVAAETALIEARMRNIQTQVKMIGSTNRMFAGMYSGKVQGIMIGLAFMLTLGLLLMI